MRIRIEAQNAYVDNYLGILVLNQLGPCGTTSGGTISGGTTNGATTSGATKFRRGSGEVPVRFRKISRITWNRQLTTFYHLVVTNEYHD